VSDTHQPIPFGEYSLLEKIATGGMAEVWRARAYGMAGFEKILVIKKVLPKLSKDDEFIQLFVDEAKIAVQLLHVNIVQVFELERVDGQYYMAMEYVHGLDLSRMITRARNLGPFPIPLALFVICEVLKALQFAHDQTGEEGGPLNVVHCDISPQNILISYSGEVKLTDFGISRAAFQAKSLHQVVRGKYAYMSPEQVEGRALDRRTDLFSLAIVLYEMLTGRRLFKTRNRDETLARVRRAEVPSPRAYRSELSEELEGILLRALSRRAEDRFQNASQFLDSLSSLMVREGHRATNNDVAAYLKSVINAAAAAARGEPLRSDSKQSGRAQPPSAVVVLSVEASPPPRSIASPRTSLPRLTQEWAALVGDSGGEVWERGEASLLVVWVARGGLRASIKKAVDVAQGLQQATLGSGFRLSAGLCPGVARIDANTRRPKDDWELSGPFYLARWMMNLSAHRGRVLLTEVGAQQVGKGSSLLGRIPIQGNRYINLYELS
jgi:serine/threonine protein kinase